MKTMVPPPRKRVLMHWIAFAFLLVASGVNIFITFQIPRIHNLYHDMGVVRLPSYTAFLFRWSFLFWFFALLWPTTPTLILGFRLSKTPMRWVLTFILASVIQSAFTICTLMRPLYYPYDSGL